MENRLLIWLSVLFAGSLISQAAAVGAAQRSHDPAPVAGRLPVQKPASSSPAPGARGGSTPAPPAVVPIVLLRRGAKDPPDDRHGDVLVIADPATDEIAGRAARMRSDSSGYAQFVLRLDRYARTYLARDPALPQLRRAVLAEPAHLFLSDRQGGFPAEGFWLEQPDGSLKEMRDVPFVDTVVNERDLAACAIDGLEAIYAHELGHLIMAALAGKAPRRASNAVHFVTVRTDAWTAFTEGWGEHFQPAGLDHYPNAPWQARRDAPPPEQEQLWHGRFAREQVEGCGICPANLTFLTWHGSGEQRLRDGPLRANHFVYEVELPPALRGDGRPAFEARMYRDVVTPVPGGRLKNASQMLSSEGVIATLFHRLTTDDRLRNVYREPAFYESFLPAGRAGDLTRLAPQAFIPPAENVYLKLFEVMHREFTWDAWPAIDIVLAYARRFPDEADAVFDVFLDVTRGVPLEQAAFARHGGQGYLADLRRRLAAGTVKLSQNVGRPLWIVASDVSFGMGLFRYVPLPSPFTFDLNAADAADLRSVPGVSAELASSIVRARDERTSFSGVDDLATVHGMTPALLSQFKAMWLRMEERPNKPLPQRSEDRGWIKDYLVLLLRGSYYGAAAWQYGRALAIAAAAYGVMWWLVGALLRIERRRLSPSARWWRRVARASGLALAAALGPCLIGVALYSRSVLPTPAIMAGVGALYGCLVAGGLVATGRAAVAERPQLARVIVAVTAASGVIGSVY